MTTYTLEPEHCVECGSDEKMALMDVEVDGEKREAWICDECGHAHIKSTKEATK